MESQALCERENGRIKAMRITRTYGGRGKSNLSEYMFASTAVGVCVALLALVALFTGEPLWLLFYPVMSIPLAMLQLVSGGYLVAKWSRLGARFRHGLRNYWLLNLVYVLGLSALLVKPYFPDYFLTFWLLVLPWFIAAYQFVIVYQYWRTRKMQAKS